MDLVLVHINIKLKLHQITDSGMKDVIIINNPSFLFFLSNFKIQ